MVEAQDPSLAAAVATWPAEVQAEWDERAAIIGEDFGAAMGEEIAFRRIESKLALEASQSQASEHFVG